MALAQYREKFWFPSGTLAADIPARVFLEDNNVLAPLFTDATGTTPEPNPTRTDAQGFLDFWVEEGVYWLHIDTESFRITVGGSGEPATEGFVLAAIATHNADTTDVHGIPDTAQLVTQADLTGLATDAELAAVQADLDAHEADTTAVHGIADTAALETTTGAQAKADTAENNAIATAAADATQKANQAETNAEQTAAAALNAHAADTTDVHGITDTSVLATQADLSGFATSGDLATVANDLAAHEADTLTVHGIPDTSVLVTQADIAPLATDAQVTAVQDNLTAHAAATTNVHGIADTAVLATDADLTAVQDNLNAHIADTTAVHGIADTALLETQAGAQAKADAAETDAVNAAAASAASLYVPLTEVGAADGVATLDADSLVPEQQVPFPHVWWPADLGLKAWVCDPVLTQSTGIFPGSGPMRMAAVVLRRPDTVDRIVWHFHGYAGGLQTGSWAGVWRASDGVRVGSVPDLSAPGSEPAEQHGLGGNASFTPLSEGAVALGAGIYYIAWRMVYDAGAGDGPLMLALENSAGAPSNTFGLNNTFRFGFNGAPPTTLPSALPTMDVGGGNRFWAALA